MKFRNLLLAVFIFIGFSSISQMNISTDLREDYIWDTSIDNWSFVSSDDSEYTFFKFNEDLTMFNHTTASMSSAYIINSDSYDEELEQYLFDITSDVGNNYVMIIDIANNNVRFIGESEGTSFRVRHNIKRLWIEE